MRGLVYCALLFVAFIVTGLPVLASALSAPASKQTYELPVDDVDHQLPGDNMNSDIALRWRPFRRRCCCMNSDNTPSIAVATFEASALQG